MTTDQQRIRGALHIHSTYSDSEFTLRELKSIFQAAGCALVAMTDHAPDFDDDKVRAYVEECKSLSDESFRFVPGLEFGCEQKMHIVGYGVTQLVATQEPQQVMRHIAQSGGISVIAHPKAESFEWIESFDTLPDGIEVWNSKYDGRFAPRVETFELLNRLQTRQPSLRAFYGQDLRWKQQFRGLFTHVQSTSATRNGILEALRRGDYYGCKDDVELPADGQLKAELVAQFRSQQGRSQHRWRLMKRAKEFTSRVGVPIPAPLKAQLRRMF